MAEENRATVAVAFGANLLVAVAKLIGGLIGGSVAMLAEAAHSLADTVNQVFLFVSLTMGARPPDEEHPFGYGKERFFWAFLAAVFIFVAGAVFSFIEGFRALFGSGGEESYLVSYVVLAVALCAEGTSLTRAVHQTRSEARAEGRGFAEHVRASKDPTLKVVLLEDTAAVIGIVLAATGIGLHELTGDHRWDALGSIAIGVLLSYVAYRLGRDTKGLLLGEAALPEDRDAIRDAVASHPDVEEVFQVLTMAVGPHSILAAVRASFPDDIEARDIEAAATRIETAARDAVPELGEFFLDPTSRADWRGARTRAEHERARAERR